ncbi:hypothetical protein KEM52_003954 [Ascosphaera acerosa]|nr:hypothetical protein KEM52_003954 [Ascosphaera acerosa]
MPQDVEMASASDETPMPTEDRRPLLTLPLRQGSAFLEVEQSLNGAPLPSLSLNTRGELAKKILARVEDGQVQLRQLDWGRAQPQARLTRPSARAGDQALLLTCALLPPGIWASGTACVCCILRRTTDTCDHMSDYAADTAIVEHEDRELRGLEASRKNAIRASQQLLRPFGLQVTDDQSRALPSLELDDSDEEVVMQRRLRKLGLVAVTERELKALRDVREIHRRCRNRQPTPPPPPPGSPGQSARIHADVPVFGPAETLASSARSSPAATVVPSTPGDADQDSAFVDTTNFSPLQQGSPVATDHSQPPDAMEGVEAAALAASAPSVNQGDDCETAAALDAQLQADCAALSLTSEVNNSSTPASSALFSGPRIGPLGPICIEDSAPTSLGAISTPLDPDCFVTSIADLPVEAVTTSADDAASPPCPGSPGSTSSGEDVESGQPPKGRIVELPLRSVRGGEADTGVTAHVYPQARGQSLAARTNLPVIALNNGSFMSSGDDVLKSTTAMRKFFARPGWAESIGAGLACGTVEVDYQAPWTGGQRSPPAPPTTPAVTADPNESGPSAPIDGALLGQQLRRWTGKKEESDGEIDLSPFGGLPAAPGWFPGLARELTAQEQWCPSWPGFELEFDDGLTKDKHCALLEPKSWLSDAHVFAYLSLLCRAGNHHCPGHYGVVPPAFVRHLLFPGDGVTCGELPGYPQVVSMAQRAYILFFPVLLGSNHWALLACSAMAQQCVVLDSLKPCRGAGRFMEQVEEWLVANSALPPGLPLRRFCNASPAQKNDFDCGLFLCANARVIVDAATIDIKPTFTQRDVTRFR